MNFWPRYIGDIQRKTGHLSCAEMGVYDRLLDHMYATEAPLPGDLDSICRIARAMNKAERGAVESVLRQFFDLDAGVYANGRVTQEIAKALPKLEAARANGKLGGRPKRTKAEPNGLPSGTHEEPRSKAPQNHTSTPTEIEEIHTPRAKRSATVCVQDLVALGVDQQNAADWLRTRKEKKLPLTKTALDGVQREASKAGLTLAAAVKTAAESSWGGFKASWVDASGKPRPTGGNGSHHNGAEPAWKAEQRARIFEMTGGLMGRESPPAGVVGEIIEGAVHERTDAD